LIVFGFASLSSDMAFALLGLIQTSSVAEAYWALHNQSRDGWTHELDLRPYSERW
jgi:hypothetical protein